MGSCSYCLHSSLRGRERGIIPVGFLLLLLFWTLVAFPHPICPHPWLCHRPIPADPHPLHPHLHALQCSSFLL